MTENVGSVDILNYNDFDIANNVQVPYNARISHFVIIIYYLLYKCINLTDYGLK